MGDAGTGGRGAETGRAADYLARQQPETATDVALVAMARAAAGDRPDDLLPRLRAHRPGKLVNATIWTILGLRQAGEPAPGLMVQALLRAQRPSGGWSWLAGGAADANDTAAALQALRAAGVGGHAIDRGVAFLRRHQNPDGGFELTLDRGSDTPVDRVGGPRRCSPRGVHRRGDVPLPGAHAAPKRELPLQRALR